MDYVPQSSGELTEQEEIVLSELLEGRTPEEAFDAAGLPKSMKTYAEFSMSSTFRCELMLLGNVFLRGTLQNAAMQRLYKILQVDTYNDAQIMGAQVRAAKLVADMCQLTSTRAAAKNRDSREPAGAIDPEAMQAQLADTRDMIERLSSAIEHQGRTIDITPAPGDEDLLDL